ncbi:hypothetical protein HPB50_019798 [Hyalomma asiaticum]|uniref:Uncharacterized protein n=1 Tax=Hyalomma asiaticum TaxID=266040 RepID=A0ACB7SJB2_HYAAI|nr:hypothetical protein HPB50_019798 [Hyalomma asiaticum]
MLPIGTLAPRARVMERSTLFTEPAGGRASVHAAYATCFSFGAENLRAARGWLMVLRRSKLRRRAGRRTALPSLAAACASPPASPGFRS